MANHPLRSRRLGEDSDVYSTLGSRHHYFPTILAISIFFYVFQCLKESYVKAVGVGIGMDLKRIEFHVYSQLAQSSYVADTRVYIDGEVQENWRFEETLLDDKHCVATALCLEV